MLNINSRYRNFQAQPSIGFKGLSDGNKSQTTTGADEKSQTKLGTKGKVILGTTITGLAALGIYLATRGKSNKFEKFINGRAVNKHGNGITGVINKPRKDGSNLVMTYENGILKESKVMSGDTVISCKTYTYDDNGKISKIIDHNGKKAEFEHDAETGKLIQHTNFEGQEQRFYYDKNGSLKYMSGYKIKKEGLNESGLIKNAFVEFDPVTKKPLRAYQNGYIANYNKTGEMESITRVLDYRTIDGKEMLSIDGDYLKGHSSEIYRKITPDTNMVIEMSSEYLQGSMAGTRNIVTEIKCGNKPNGIRNQADFCEYISKDGKRTGRDLYYMTFEHKGNIYTFDNNYEKGNDVLEVSKFGKKPFAKYNTKTGELELLPNSEKSLEEVTDLVDNAKSFYKKMLKQYRNIYREDKVNQEFANIAEHRGNLPHTNL